MAHPGWRWDGTQWVPTARKQRTGLIISLAVGLPLLVLALCLGGALLAFSGDSDSGPGAVPRHDAAEPTDTTGRDGQFEFTVLDVTRGVAPPDEYFSEPAQGEYVEVRLRVENVGDEPREFDSHAQKLFDTDGREYDASWGIGEWEYATVNPGNQLEVDIYYDVRPEVALDRLRLHDSLFSGGVDVGLPE